MPRRSPALFFASLLLFPAPGHTGNEERSDSDSPGAVAILSSVGEDTSPADLKRAVRAFAAAPEAAAVILELASLPTGSAAGGAAQQVLTPCRLQVITSAIPLLSRGTVPPTIERGLAARPSPAWRSAALRLLEVHGTGVDVSLLVAVAVDERGRVPEECAVLDNFQKALARIVARDLRALQVLPTLPAVPDTLRKRMIRAVGAAEAPEAIEWLTSFLDEPDFSSPALQEIGRLAPLASEAIAHDAALQIRPLLGHEDTKLRKHAIRSLSSLGDVGSVPGLIGFLGKGDRGEQRTALSALRRLTGRNLPDSAPSWQAWYEAEKRWVCEHATDTLARLGSERDADVVGAVRALSEHTLYRELVVPEILMLLEGHASPTVRSQVCLALGQLGSRTALPGLVQALNDDEESVCEAARSTLSSLTHLDLPADARAWEEALRLP